VITIIVNQDAAFPNNRAWSMWTRGVITIYKGRETSTGTENVCQDLHIHNIQQVLKYWII